MVKPHRDAPVEGMGWTERNQGGYGPSSKHFHGGTSVTAPWLQLHVPRSCANSGVHNRTDTPRTLLGDPTPPAPIGSPPQRGALGSNAAILAQMRAAAFPQAVRADPGDRDPAVPPGGRAALSVRPSVRPAILVSAWLPVHLSVLLPGWLSVRTSTSPSVCPSIRPSICPSVLPSYCLFVLLAAHPPPQVHLSPQPLSPIGVQCLTPPVLPLLAAPFPTPRMWRGCEMQRIPTSPFSLPQPQPTPPPPLP